MLREELYVAVPTAFLKDESLNVQGIVFANLIIF